MRTRTALKASPAYSVAAPSSGIEDSIRGEKGSKATVLRSHPTPNLTRTQGPFQLKYTSVSRDFSTSHGSKPYLHKVLYL